MKMKAQISVFLIVGIVIVTIIAITTEMQKQTTQKDPVTSSLQDPSTMELQRYVESCLRDVGERAVHFVMLQGGYYYAPDSSIPLYSVSVVPYWQDGQNLMPDREHIQDQLGLFTEENLYECLNGFSDFIGQGYEVRASPRLQQFFPSGLDDTRVLSVITSSAVLFTLQSPIQLSKGDQEYSVESFSALVNINLDKPLRIVEQLMVNQQDSPDFVPLGPLAQLAYDNNFKFEILHYDNNTVITGLFFKQPYKEDLVYAFAQRYEWDQNSISPREAR